LLEKIKKGEFKLDKKKEITMKRTASGIFYNNYQFNDVAFMTFDNNLKKLSVEQTEELYVLKSLQSLPVTLIST